MKTLFTLLSAFLLMSSMSNAQSINKTEPQQFWETNIQAIIDGDVDQVVEQSYFPMSTFEGDWKKGDFVDAFDILFDDEAVEVLKSQSYRSIQAMDDGTGNKEYVVVIHTEMEVDGEVFESATILSFKKFEGEWKLYSIDMAG